MALTHLKANLHGGEPNRDPCAVVRIDNTSLGPVMSVKGCEKAWPTATPVALVYPLENASLLSPGLTDLCCNGGYRKLQYGTRLRDVPMWDGKGAVGVGSGFHDNAVRVAIKRHTSLGQSGAGRH